MARRKFATAEERAAAKRDRNRESNWRQRAARRRTMVRVPPEDVPPPPEVLAERDLRIELMSRMPVMATHFGDPPPDYATCYADSAAQRQMELKGSGP